MNQSINMKKLIICDLILPGPHFSPATHENKIKASLTRNTVFILAVAYE